MHRGCYYCAVPTLPIAPAVLTCPPPPQLPDGPHLRTPTKTVAPSTPCLPSTSTSHTSLVSQAKEQQKARKAHPHTFRLTHTGWSVKGTLSITLTDQGKCICPSPRNTLPGQWQAHQRRTRPVFSVRCRPTGSSLRHLPWSPRASLRQMHSPQTVEWSSGRSQKEWIWEVGRRGRPCNLLRLAVTLRLPVHKPQRAAQVLRLRKDKPRSPKLSSSGEGMRQSPRTSTACGQQNSHVWACTQNTQPLLMVYVMVSISASLIYLAHTFRLITHQSHTSRTCITLQSTTSLQLAVTSALSRARRWRPKWALSKHRPCPSFPKHPSLTNTEPYTTSPSPTNPRQRQHPLIPISIARISHVPGEPSPPSHSLLHTCPRAHRHPYVMWQKRTGQSQPTHHSGQAWSYAYRMKTSTLSMCATTLVSPQQEECTEWWQMQAQTFSVAMGLDHWQNGSMTMYSSESHVNTYQPTTSLAQNGAVKLDCKEVANRMVAVYGTREKIVQMASQRSLMKTATSHSRTWQQHPLAVQRTKSSHMRMQTLMPFRGTWGSAGNPPNPFRSDQKCPTWASCGTYTHARSAFLKRKGSNTWPRSQNGRKSQHTPCWKHRSYTGNSSTRPWSYTQDALMSPTWRPCSPPSGKCKSSYLVLMCLETFFKSLLRQKVVRHFK